MGNALLSDIGRDTTVQNSHPHDNLYGAVTELFEDGMSVSLCFANYDEHYSEILLRQQRLLYIGTRIPPNGIKHILFHAEVRVTRDPPYVFLLPCNVS